MAMEFLRRLGNDPALHLDPEEPHSIKVDGRGIDHPDLRYRICHLFDLPWWKRTWTVQEFLLARRLIIQCGGTWITGDLLDKVIKSFVHHRNMCCQRNELWAILGTSLILSFQQAARLHFIANALRISTNNQ